MVEKSLRSYQQAGKRAEKNEAGKHCSSGGPETIINEDKGGWRVILNGFCIVFAVEGKPVSCSVLEDISGKLQKTANQVRFVTFWGIIHHFQLLSTRAG